MKNLYPLFEQNRILKKELLWSLRDYSFAHIQLEYQEYAPGIIRGCRVSIKKNKLVVSTGLIKAGDFICLFTAEESAVYEAINSMQYLKLKVMVDHSVPDYISYESKLYLDTKEAREENEFELCRFYLREGASLRDTYKSFYDMETEYDTVNLIYASWSARGGTALAPDILKYYAERILQSKNSEAEDLFIAYQCLCGENTMERSILAAYLSRRLGEEKAADNYELYKQLGRVLEKIGLEQEQPLKRIPKRNYIIVD